MPTPTPEQGEVFADLRQAAARLRTVTKRATALYGERAALYCRARALGASWRDIARAAGVTDAAVMRAVERAQAPEGEAGAGEAS